MPVAAAEAAPAGTPATYVGAETCKTCHAPEFKAWSVGVRDAKYDKFDIKPVLERLLLKGPEFFYKCFVIGKQL